MQKIETIFKNANLLHDRFFNESFQLPYAFESIKIEGNDLSTYRIINDSLSKLYDNFLYLYGLTKMASNAVPAALSGIYAVSGTNTAASWYNSALLNLNNTSPFYQAGLPDLDNVKSFSITYSELYNGFLMAAITDTSLVIASMAEDDSSFSVILSSSVADSYLTLPFQDLKNAKFIGDYLYVLDRYYNNLYRYDLKGLLSDDIFPKILKIDNTIGGFGIFQDKYKFNSPSSFCVLKENLYVLDAGNYSIKEYDKNFINLNVYQYRGIFGADAPVYIDADEYTGKVFVVTTNKLLYIFEPGFTSYTYVDVSNIITSSVTFKNIFASKSFKNCLYIVTSQDIYKIYISKPKNIVGKYSLYRFGVSVDDIVCAESAPSVLSPGTDAIYLFTNVGAATNIIQTSDSENFISVLSLSDFEVYTKDEILVNKEEYTQTWVINKAIVKMLLNHLRLKDKIKGRFTGKYDENGNPLLVGTLYFLLDDLDLTAYTITLDHFAGNNEVLSSAVVNRGLQKIYDLQLTMINKSNTIIQSSSFFENQSVSIG